ncbi:MAG: hypothetical protein ACYC75_01490 [Minisyncoccota bacterium]
MSTNVNKIWEYLGFGIIVALCTLFVWYLLQQTNPLPFHFSRRIALNTAATDVQIMRTMPPLSSADEAVLQAQLQEIVAKGSESDCASLVDLRYQFACHSFFSIKKK